MKQNSFLRLVIILCVLSIAACATYQGQYIVTPPENISEEDRQMFKEMLTWKSDDALKQDIPKWKAFAERYPQSHAAHNNLGAAYLSDQQWDRAIEELDVSLQIQNTDKGRDNLLHALKLRSKNYRQGKFYHNAIVDLRWIKTLDPSSADKTQKEIESIQKEFFDHISATNRIEDFQSFVELYPESELSEQAGKKVVELGGQMALTQPQVSTVVDILARDASIGFSPEGERDEDKEYLKSGIALMVSKRFDESNQKYEIAQGLNWKNVKIQLNHSYSLLLQNHLEEALKKIHVVAQLSPDNPDVYYVWGLILWKMGDLEGKQEKWDRVLELNPDYTRAFRKKARGFAEDGLTQDAIIMYRKAIEVDPGDYWAYLELGYLHNKEGNFTESFLAYRKASSLRPEDAFTHYSLGIVLAQIAQYDKAIEELAIAIKLYPNFPKAYFNWGSILKTQGHYEEAIKKFRIAIKLAPYDPEGYFHLGQTLMKLTRYKEALEVYTIATQYNPNYGLAYYDMGIALMSMNNLEKSLPYFLRAKNLEPDLAFPKEVRASLGFDRPE